MLAAVDPAAAVGGGADGVGAAAAANQFWMLSEPERATAFLQTTRSQVSRRPAARTTVDALSATFAMNAGNLGRARRRSPRRCWPRRTPTTRRSAGRRPAAALVLRRASGRFAEVDALAERAMAAEHPGLLRFTSGFGQTTALVMAGESDEALRSWRSS